MKKIYFLLFMVMLFPINARAIYEITDPRCTDSVKGTLKEKASYVTYRLSRYEENNTTLYKGYILNNDADLLLKNSKDEIIKEELLNLKEGSRTTINIYASSNSYCDGYKISSLIINVPFYNEYSTSELCIGYEDHNLCKKNSNISLTKEEFENQMKLYILENKGSGYIPNPIVNDTPFNLISFIKENYINFIVAGILLVVFVILIMIDRRNKNKDIL